MFSARRKPTKRIARDDAEPEMAEEDEDGPVVRRPGISKAKSNLRISFQPDEAGNEEHVVTKKPGSSLPRYNVDRQTETRPSYDKSSLDALRNSTPSTPQDLQSRNPSETGLDLVAKFGTTTVRSNAIPSAAEIKEKKERRARLAKEQGADDFIPLEDYDSDGEFKPQRMQVGSYLEREAKDTRLVRDDEDFAEGFDEFVEDAGRVTMGRKALMEQARKDRENIRDLIDQAEGSEDDESDSEVERNYAYESAQTHHGMDGLATHQQHRQDSSRPQQPRETTQIPKLAVALGRLKETIQSIEMEKVRIERRHAEVRKERSEIKANQEHIQKSLEEAGKEMERLQASGEINKKSTPQRGLDSLET